MRRLGLVILGALACANGPAGGQAVTTIADRHDFETRSMRADLPGRLDEVSGLAFTPDGRLFAHDDERGRVYEIDPETLDVGKRFDLGDGSVRADFEGIAIVGTRFFLISSTGILYEFAEADDDESTRYRTSDTGLGATCEVEGLTYDERADELLIACKVATPNRGEIVVHRLPLDPSAARQGPSRIQRSQLSNHGLDDDFAPSGITIDPATGTLVLVSAQTEAVIEVARDGSVLSGVQLSRGRHPQPEGVAFGLDGALYIADERNGQDARVTVYARRTLPGGRP